VKPAYGPRDLIDGRRHVQELALHHDPPGFACYTTGDPHHVSPKMRALFVEVEKRGR
jgi:hypothetical protein